MCADMRNAPTEVFNSSYLFFTQIRCGWVQFTRRDIIVLPDPAGPATAPAGIRALLAPGTCKTSGTPVAPRQSPTHSPKTPYTPVPGAPAQTPVTSPITSTAPVQNHGIGLPLGMPKARAPKSAKTAKTAKSANTSPKTKTKAKARSA
jgi:hypothetical protein